MADCRHHGGRRLPPVSWILRHAVRHRRRERLGCSDSLGRWPWLLVSGASVVDPKPTCVTARIGRSRWCSAAGECRRQWLCAAARSPFVQQLRVRLIVSKSLSGLSLHHLLRIQPRKIGRPSPRQSRSAAAGRAAAGPGGGYRGRERQEVPVAVAPIGPRSLSRSCPR